ncbi:MAG: terminase family protein, partial [Cystobacter sp.]
MQPLINVLQRIIKGERVRIVVHTPPRHGKTETLLHFIAWGLLQRPNWTFGYCSYNAGIAYSKSRVAMDLALTSGIHLSTKNASEWRTGIRGGTLATGIGGTLTGFGLNVGIVDDPVKNRLEAESATYRERTWDWFRDVFLTRIEPGGSVIVNMARWHPDDLAGRLISKGWEYLRLPALDEASTKQLWPTRWPLEEMLQLKEDLGIYSWESLYQGNPRPRGGAVFGDPLAWEEGHKQWRAGIGLDLAFSSKSSSDYSVIVVMKEWNGVFHVVDVVRVQTTAPRFKEMVRNYHRIYPHARMRWYASGTEKGSADFFRASAYDPLKKATVGGIPVEVITAHADKFTRAIPYAASWNAKKV